MRVLIITAVLACAAAVPSGLLASSYGHGLYGQAGPLALGHSTPLAVAHGVPLAVAHAAPLAVAAPTISSGDIQGAAIEAHVEASDHVRATVDAARQQHDKVAELHGQAINAAENHSWQAVDAVKTREAQLNGAAAGAAPILAKQIVGHGAYAAPVVSHAGYAAPIAYAAYAAAPIAHSNTVVSQSLHQSHLAPLVHAFAPAVSYGAHAYSAPAYGHGW